MTNHKSKGLMIKHTNPLLEEIVIQNKTDFETRPRLRLHDGKLIKDRRYHLRTYPNCFVAKELTDWLIDHKEAPDRETGIRLMQKLMDHYIIHHVCDEHSDYKDAKLLYRFRKDDGTFPLNKDVKVFLRGQSLYEALVSADDSILKVREEKAVRYQRAFLGCEMVDWLTQEGEAASRKEAVELCRALLEHGIIQHVSTKHHFFDSNLLYQFRINFRRRRRLTELLTDNLRTVPESSDSPFCLRKLNPDQGNTSFLSVKIKEKRLHLAYDRHKKEDEVTGRVFISTNEESLILMGFETEVMPILQMRKLKQGEPGPPGQTGPEGPGGQQGSPGTQGLTVQGPVGPPGLKGEKGDIGHPGLQGHPGHQGPPGRHGLQGPKGMRGFEGTAGFPGPPGPRGFQGIAGARGINGEKGSPGDVGPTGLPGPKGERGEKVRPFAVLFHF
ncbi:DEP domain-containing mTOR-interacting protein-like [Gracilinanus agilis]|uniref:DEP domain-containing mTOR-interacting protein-like n=1 Tax=Gracilinanus agilis TaxID=191870 RepID=UPI001CFD8E25|nr:DEP domain-containing mTOR-interacting protein-like [Gracilinanus agilis]